MTTTAPVTTTPDRDGRLWWLVIVPLLGLILGALVLILVWSPGLPAEVATQWAWGEGTVTTVRPLWSSVLPMALIALGFLLGILILVGTGRLTSWGRRLNLGVLAGVTAMIAVAPVVLLAGQRGHDFAWDAPDPVGTVAGAAAVCVLYAAAVTLLVGNRPLSDAPPENAAATAVRMDLAEEEDAVWARTTTAWACVLLGLAGLGVTIAGIVVDGLWPLALLGSVLVLLGVGLSRWTVVVDRAGVCCTGPLQRARGRRRGRGRHLRAWARGVSRLGHPVRGRGVGRAGLPQRRGAPGACAGWALPHRHGRGCRDGGRPVQHPGGPP
jgi:hypothetical protein